MTNLRERRIESTAGAAREREEGMVMRKGPWTVEEDEVLLDYVRKYGPRDWSSIRNKGLLPRTGKSCRLRWVNKLKPNLKTGCKFSAEEERVVIELQAQFGNKWAKIATYLPGRTDNDVKNFWSTRQKRLARMLQSPKPHKNAAKMNSFKQMPDFESPAPIQVVTFDEGSSSGNQSCQPLFTEHLKTFTMVDLPDLISQAPLNQDSDLPSYDMQRADQTSTVFDPSMPLALPLPPPALDLPLLPEDQDFIPELMDPGSMDMFVCQSADDAPDNGLGLPADLRMFGMTAAGQSDIKQDGNPRTLDSFFDDLPSDMFDCIDPISASSQWQNGPGGQ